jgi:hypothetical protein
MVLFYRRSDWEADVDHELIGCQYRKSDGTMLTSCQSNGQIQLSQLLAKDR